MRHRGLAALVWAGAVGWSAWLTSHSWKAQSYRDPSAAWADVVASAATMTAWATATGDIDGHDWTIGLGLSAAGAAAVASDTRAEWLAAAGALSATHLLCRDAAFRDAMPGARRLTDAAFFFCFGALGASLAGRLRSSASEIASMSVAAMNQARVRAQLEERAKAAHELRAGALDTLEEVRSRWHEHDRAPLRNRARREALRLRQALGQGDRGEAPSDFAARLERLAERYTTRGLTIELITAEVDEEPPTATSRGLLEAASLALDHLVSQGQSAKVVIRAATTKQGALVTLRASQGSLGGLAHQVGVLEELLAGVGSTALVHEDTRLILEVPA